MAKTYTYPHWEVNVIDRSIYTATTREELPLFRPIFFMRAQRGTDGVPVWVGTYNEAKTEFGDLTFDYDSEYFSREALYLRGLFSRQGAFIVRMVPDDAATGSLLLQLEVRVVDVIQYEKDDDGQFILDDNDEKIPKTDSSTGATITEEGIQLKWTTRALDLDTEDIDTLKPTTYSTGSTQYTVYPILACKATSAGAYANNTGVKFFCDTDDLDTDLAEELGTIPYEFGAVEWDYDDETVDAVYSSYDNQYETFSAKSDATDSRTEKDYGFEKVLSNYYDGLLPFEVHLYSDNIETIGTLIQSYETDDETLYSPYMVNLCEPYNVDGVPYDHVVLSTDDDAITLTSSTILYLSGGTDGTIDDDTIERLTRQYLDDLPYTQFLDQARYPFTHIIDTGVSIDTKQSFIEFLGTHDAFKVVLSTQNANLGRFNTEEEDQSTGASLYADCLLQPESTVKGTEVCRAEIYQHAGYLADSDYDGIVPFTYDICLKKSKYMSTTSITGQPAGLPNSEISVFSEWNWAASDPDRKQQSWDSGLNYMQYYDRTGIHWPAMRTVYRYDTSVLTSALFTDVIVFTKHILRYNWSRFAGVEIPFETLSARASSTVTNDMSAMLNGMFKFDVTFYQTEEEANIGYISHATLRIWGNPQQRVWKIDIECYRNGYDPDSDEEE